MDSGKVRVTTVYERGKERTVGKNMEMGIQGRSKNENKEMDNDSKGKDEGNYE